MPPAVSVPSAPAAAPDTSLFAKPGESILDYETRLGSTTGGGAGKSFGTPAPIAPTLVPKSQGGTGPEVGAPAAAAGSSATDPLSASQDSAAQAAGYASWADAVSKLTAPSQDTTDFYNNAYSAAGLDALQQKINQKNSDLNTALGTINDNPWLDEASRVGRSKSLQTLAQGDIKNITAQYDAGLKNVNTLVSNHSKDVSASDASNKAKLSFLEAQAKAQAAQTNLTTKTSNAAPKTIKGANGATFKWDPTSGQFTQILPGKSPTINSTDPNVVLPKFNKDLTNRTTLDKAGTREQFIRQLQTLYPTISPDDIARKVYETYPDGYDSAAKAKAAAAGAKAAGTTAAPVVAP